MFGDLTTTEQRMSKDSADWFDEEFGTHQESRLETFLGFLCMVLLISIIVFIVKVIAVIW